MSTSSLALQLLSMPAMKIQSWLATCSSDTCTAISDNSIIPYNDKRIASPTLSVSDGSDTSGCSSRDTSSSIQSNLSLQTLPSVPSLQNLSPETLNISVSHLSVTSVKPRPFPVYCLAVSGDHLLYAASGSEINVYDSSTFTHIDAFNGPDSSSGSVKSITFSGGKVFTAHQDSKIKVWQLTATKRHKLLTTLPTVNDRLRRFILPKNYVNVRRHKKRLWIEHVDAVSGLASNNGLICSVSWDKYLKIWRTSDLRCVESVKAHEDAVNAVVVSADGTVYTGSADRRIRVWAKPIGEKRHALVATLEKHKSAVNALALSNDGSVLFSGACDRSILVWEREDSANHMSVTGALRGHDRAILCLINVSDLLLSGSADRTIRIWQRGLGGQYCCLAVLEGHLKPVKSLVAVAGSADTISVISGSLDGEIKVWKVLVSNLNCPVSSEYLR